MEMEQTLPEFVSILVFSECFENILSQLAYLSPTSLVPIIKPSIFRNVNEKHA